MASDVVRSVLAVALLLGSGAVVAAGCAQSDPVGPVGSSSAGGDGDGDGTGDGDDGGIDPQNEDGDICLLHNCSEDAHCAGCAEGRTTCLIEDAEAEPPRGRCVACGEDTPGGCPEGQECSSWGNCVPEGLTCETDATGTPVISCATNADCAACDPMHQVCDAGKCVACTPTNTASCQTTDLCVDNQCTSRCPADCTTDNDCSQCGAPGNEAHACNAHKCAECSPTYACPAGMQCTPAGTCATVCGTDGEGRCFADADCNGCKEDANTCHVPINGGAGECGPSAAGCSDLGGVALPSPFDQVTNLCSGDADCAGVGVEFNVGEMLRDITGIDDIGDSIIEYPMGVCADIQISGDISCGLCVPCRVDSDCQDIDIDQVALDAFGPLGSIAAAILLDQVFGDNDHKVHMYCEGIAGDYGVCAPCPGFIYDCGVDDGGSSSSSGSGSGSGSGGGGSCDHDPCDPGTPLDGSCDACAANVCAVDEYCCTTEWDTTCVGEADTYCDDMCSGGSGSGSGSGGGGGCHDECMTGAALEPSCNECVAYICDQDPYCCDTEWDSTCVGQVTEYCDPGC